MYSDHTDSVAASQDIAEHSEDWNRTLLPLMLCTLVILLGSIGIFRPRPVPAFGVWGGRSAEVPGGLDLNQAAWFELAQLPGVGEKLARRIVEYRKNAGLPLRIRDLIAVKGIGPRKIGGIAAFLHADRE